MTLLLPLAIGCADEGPRSHLRGDTPSSTADEPRRPFPQPVTLAPGALRPSVGQDAVDDAVRAAYDDWVDAYLAAEPDGAFRVRMAARDGAPTTSEGQGYGMVLVATMAGHDPRAHARFDGLFRYHRAHRSDVDPRLMDWHVPADGAREPGDDDSAFDGDADAALGLLLADAQWGSDGPVDYRAEAETLLAAQRSRVLGPTTRWPLLGDWVDPDGSRYSEWTPRSSDWMPASFRAFGWDDAVDAAYAAVAQVQREHAPETGLLPDFLAPDGAGGLRPADPGFLEGPHDGDWSYNAFRFPWRLGVDAATTGDPRAVAALRPVTTWAAAVSHGDPAALATGYTLAGEPLPGYRWASSITAAPLMVAALTGDDPDWLDATFAAVRDAREGYYEDTVSLQCLLAVSGRAWWPTPP